MKNSQKWLVLAAVLLWLTGCYHNSEAKVNVVNKGELSINATIYSTNSLIAPGLTETFTLSWPGRGDINVSLFASPVGDLVRSVTKPLVLNDGDDITVNVEFNKI
jgi:hypothetical protein